MKLIRRLAKDISILAEANIPPLLKRLYIQRGICNVNELKRSTSGLLNFNSLKGIEQAVNLLENALINQYSIMIVGDFDVDGATSTALTVLALQYMGAKKIDFLVPNRFKDGYGLSPEIVSKAAVRGAQLIITVDNGISSHEGVALARKKNISVIITDHHIPNNTLPTADAIINPNLDNSKFISKSLAGVGVAFYLMLALRSKLKKIGWFKEQNILVPKLAILLDLVALGTIADMVPLDTNNRILVYQGISRIRAGYCRPGIRALVEVANRDITRLYATDLGFLIGPMLNAAGRLDDMSIGVLLLLSENMQQAILLASKLNILNKTRRKIEQKMEIKALKICKSIITDEKNIPFGFVIYNQQWHQGLLGILASRIKDRFHRPVIVFAPAGEGILKGSGRSIHGLHMYDLLKRLNTLYPGMILNFGGHAMAVGLTLHLKQFDDFRQRFVELIYEWLDPEALEGIILSDGELATDEFSLATAEMLRNGGPWGTGFPNPLFDGLFYVHQKRIIRKKHLKLLIEPVIGGPKLDGIAFNIDPIVWLKNNIRIVELAYNLDINECYGNRSLQLLIQYIWPISIDKEIYTTVV